MTEDYPGGLEVMVVIWWTTFMLFLMALGIVGLIQESPIDGTVPVLIALLGMLGGILAGYLFGSIAGEPPPIKWLRKNK